MRTPHSSTNKGKRVKVTLRDGSTYVGKFEEKKGSTIYLKEGTVKLQNWRGVPMRGYQQGTARTYFTMDELRAFSIYKPTA